MAIGEPQVRRRVPDRHGRGAGFRHRPIPRRARPPRGALRARLQGRRERCSRAGARPSRRSSSTASRSRSIHIFEIADREVRTWMNAFIRPLEAQLIAFQEQTNTRVEGMGRIQDAETDLVARLDELRVAAAPNVRAPVARVGGAPRAASWRSSTSSAHPRSPSGQSGRLGFALRAPRYFACSSSRVSA